MTFSDTLRAARQSAASAFHGYLLGKRQNGIHVFVEGRDDESFFLCKVRRRLVQGTPVLTLRCGTKKAVYETKDKIDRYPSKAGVNLYFVDRDHDEILGIEMSSSDADTFVTRYYSIENYLVSEEVLRTIWEEIFHLSDEPQLLARSIDTFRVSLGSFYEIANVIAAWSLAVKSAGVPLNINNVRLSNLLKFDDEMRVRLTGSRSDLITQLCTMCGVETTAVTDADVNRWLQKLNSLEPKSYIRGKLEIWFFVKFLHLLKQAVTNALAGVKKVVVRIDIVENNIVDAVGARAPEPSDVSQFLDYHLARL